jgi:hypothetical protein
MRLNEPRQLIAIPGSFGTRCFYVLFAALGRFLGVPGRLGLAARSPISSCLISSRRSDVFLAAFCGLLGVFWPLLAHLPSFAHRPFVVSYPRVG